MKAIILCATFAIARAAIASHGGHGGHGGHGYHGGHDVHHGGHEVFHGGHGGGYHEGHHHHHKSPPKYEFAYGVKDPYHGTNFGHSETRDGYHAKGQYYVNLPDGRLQKVSYFTDKWGYHPTITYEGKAHFPVHKKGYGHGHHGGHGHNHIGGHGGHGGHGGGYH